MDKQPNSKESYVAKAKEIYYDEGRIEIEDDAPVSGLCDGGRYVQAWVWVSEEDL